ncbi:MAG: UDP-N-acetylmuramoylalanyl-D-glutamate--2,6-diaminopimelate ligase [Cyanobacteria bacterium RYN_339]|nr:UDP-N-acetylmuramoylalanyl-D-glutamate--2,6-diaminopimelate ligase [Cyanobacteria bacterium RYN_339]
MNLSELVALLHATPESDARDVVERIVYDARQARLGDVFVAVPGTRVDGHDFLAQAAAGGALAALVSRAWKGEAPLPCFAVDDPRQAMATAAAALQRNPSQRLRLVGVTGTNGKTTTTSLVRALLDAVGLPTGLLGTLGAKFRGQDFATGFTTPQAPELQALLAEMARAGAQAVAMEVSSHAIDQARVYACALEVAVFTNLTRDHLDYHGTMEAYAEVKQRLFDARATGVAPKHAVINLDDPLGAAFAKVSAAPVITYGLTGAPTLRAADIVAGPAGCTFRLGALPVAVPLPGRFNVSNALAALGTGIALGFPLERLVEALATVPGVPGRAEVVTPAGHPFTAWVDYAHTPDGLENVLAAARELRPRKVIAVFGCGGDRDRTKRPMMGEVAGRLADLSVVTSDNPRSEDPAAIIREILPGLRGEHRVVPDRAEAIAAALAAAGPGDLVVIAGKGHEDYQIFADRTIHFDDREVARDVIARLTTAG